MPISRDHNTVFIHITKTGGTSIENMLGIHYDPKCPTKNMFNSEPAPDRPAYQHLTPSELEEYLLVDDKDFSKNAFRFTIVRDPWDRFVSSFEFCKSIDAENPIRSNTLEEFLQKAYEALRIGDFIHHPYHDHFRPQCDYLEDPSYFTKIYHFSHFDQAVKDIRKRTGCVAECPHLHKGPETKPRNILTMFESMYRDDIRLLQNFQQLE
jgi:hypothetical protein